jgi:hypothetical protein
MTKPLKLVVIRPGPVLHVFRDGREVEAVPLDRNAAHTLMIDLLRELRAAGDRTSREDAAG